MWTPLKSRHHAADRRAAWVTATRHSESSGSAQGVNPIATPAKITFLSPASCVPASPFPAAASLNVPNYICAGTASYYPDAGTSDVEPAIIVASVNGGTGSLTVTGSMTTTPIFQQIIGVAVNTKEKYVTLRGPKGNSVELSVPDPTQLKLVKVGDQVEVVYSEALAITVEPAPKAATKATPAKK